MKLVIASILILCFVHVQPRKLDLFTPGYEYRYEYIAQALTGIPDVDESQKAGLALKATVRVQAQKSGAVIVKIENLKSAKINAELRTVDLEKVPFQFGSVASHADQLASPIKVNYDRGLISDFETDGSEPEYVTNIKKGVLTMLQLKLDEYFTLSNSPRSSMSSRTSPSSSSLYRSYDSMKKQQMYTRMGLSEYNNGINVNDDTAVYDVMEDGLAGECETKYIVESNPWPGKPNAEVLNVTKIRDFENCIEDVEWAVSSHPTNNCSDCDAEEEDAVDSVKVVEYDIRVDSDKVVIERIESRAETVYAPLTTNADEIHTNHSKVLILRGVTTISQPLPRPINPKRHDSLQYDFPELDEDAQPTPEELHKRPASFLPLDGKKFPEVAKRLIQEITQEIARNAEVPMINTPLKVHQLARALRTLPAADLSQLIQETSGSRMDSDYSSSSGEMEHIKRRVTVDTMLMCGTQPCLAVLISKVESRQITEWEASHVLTTLPFNVRRPTAPLIEKLLRLCESEVAKKGTQIHKSCWLAFASMVDQSCGSNETTVPVSPGLESYCSDSQEERYIQAIAKQLHSAQRQENRLLFVQALGITGSPKILEVLRPIVEGDVQVSEMVRSKAVYALKNAANEAPQMVANMVAPIFFDSSETTVMRSAALITLVQSSPKPHLLERIATVTWNEDDNQLVGLITTLLDNLANTSHPCYKNEAAHASHALAFVDDDEEEQDDVGIQDSQVYIKDSFDDDYNIGSLLKLKWIANNQSIIPRKWMLKLERIIAGYSQTPFKVVVQAQGIETIIKRILGPEAAFEKLSLSDIIRTSYEGEAPKNYRELFSKLNIDPRTDDPLAISMWIQSMTTQHSMYHIDAQSILSAMQSGNYGSGLSNLFGSGIKLNWQRLFSFGFVRYQIPSSLGLPIVIKFESPAILKTRGKISVSIPETYGSSGVGMKIPKKINIHMDIKPTLSVNLITSMGVVNPLSKIVASAGVTSKTFITIPVESHINLDIEEGKLTTVLKPMRQQPSSSGHVMLFNHKVTPYTTLHHYSTFETQLAQSKPITSKDKLDQYEYPVGQELLGIPAVFKVESDEFWQDQGSFLSYLFEDNNALSLATLFWATPDFKLRHYQLLADASAARNTELSMTIDVDHLPSHIQSMLRQGQTSPKGLLPFWLGWAKLPWQCVAMDGHGSSQFPAYQTDSSRSESRRRQSMDYDDDYRMKNRMDLNDNDDDDDDDDNNDDDSMMQRSRPRRMVSPYRQSYTTPMDDDDDDNDDDDDDNTQQQFMNSWTQTTKFDSAALQSQYGSSSLQKTHISRETTKNVLKVKVDMAVKGQVSRSMRSVLTLARNKAEMEDTLNLHVAVQNPPFTPSNSLEICAAGNMKYPKLPCDYANGLNPDTVHPITSQLGISFGQTCSSQKQINIQATFSKSKDQKDVERQGKSWFFKQCQEDYHQGKKMSEACEDAVEIVGELKKMELDIQYHDLPRWLYNVSYKVDNFAKFYFYNQMSNNPVEVRNPEGHLKIKTVFDSEDPTIDIKILKPHENTYYENIYTDEISQYLKPMNARVSVMRSIMDDITAGYAPPTCKLMGSYIESFDNETYKVPLTTCKHVLTKDCSPSDLFSVLAKKLSSNTKEIEVHLLHHKIVAKPMASAHSGQFEVLLDGHQESIRPNDVQLLKSTGASGHDKVIAAVMVVGELLHIRAPYHGLWVKFDGNNAKIQASNMYRGDLCGLCSEFDGSTDQTLVGPGQCEYADPKDFTYSYAVPSSQCSAPTPSNKKVCPENSQRYSQGYNQPKSAYKAGQMNVNPFDDNNDDDDDDVVRKYRNNDDNDDDDDDDDDVSSQSSFSVKSGTNVIFRNQVKHRYGKVCFSTNTVPECKPGAYASKTESRPVAFMCVNESSPFAQKLKAERMSRPLREVSSQSIDFTDMVEAPISCQRA